MVGSKDTIRISFASRIDVVCGRSRSTIHEKGLKWGGDFDNYENSFSRRRQKFHLSRCQSMRSWKERYFLKAPVAVEIQIHVYSSIVIND